MKKRLSRGIAFLMMIIMMLSNVNLPVYASGTDTETETEAVLEDDTVAADEEEAAVEETVVDDENVFEEKQGAAAPKVYLSGGIFGDRLVKGVTELNEGETVKNVAGTDDYASYNEGVLVLDSVLLHSNINEMTAYSFGKSGEKHACIYAEGDLTIELDEELLIYLDEKQEALPEYSYGIYVTGNLTIINKYAASGLSIGQKGGISATKESAAIYCGGRLLLQDLAHYDDVDIVLSGGSVSSSEINKKTAVNGYGIYADGGITVEGIDLQIDQSKNVYAKKGLASNHAIYTGSGMSIVNPGKVEIDKVYAESEDTAEAYGISGAGSLSGTITYANEALETNTGAAKKVKSEKSFIENGFTSVMFEKSMGDGRVFHGGEHPLRIGKGETSGFEYSWKDKKDFTNSIVFVAYKVDDFTPEAILDARSKGPDTTVLGFDKNIGQVGPYDMDTGLKISGLDTGKAFLAAYNIKDLNDYLNNDGITGEQLYAKNILTSRVFVEVSEEGVNDEKDPGEVEEVEFWRPGPDVWYDAEDPCQMIKGKTSSEYLYYFPNNSEKEDVIFLAYEVEDFETATIVAAMAEGPTEDFFDFQKTVDPNGPGGECDNLIMTPLKTGKAIVCAFRISSYQAYKEGAINASELAGRNLLISKMYVEVTEGRQFTLHMNGGRFLNKEDIDLFNAIVNDYNYVNVSWQEMVYDRGSESITLVTDPDCSWNTLNYYVTEACERSGWAFRYGQVYRSNEYQLSYLTHDGAISDSDKNSLPTLYLSVPEDIKDIYLAWRPADNKEIYFDADGGSINMPEGMVLMPPSGKYTAPGYSKLILPEAHKEGYVFEGWFVEHAAADSDYEYSIFGGGDFFVENGMHFIARYREIREELTISTAFKPAEMVHAGDSVNDIGNIAWESGAAVTPNDIGMIELQAILTAVDADYTNKIGRVYNAAYNGDYFENDSVYYVLYKVSLSSGYILDPTSSVVKINNSVVPWIGRWEEQGHGLSYIVYAFNPFTLGTVPEYELSFDLGGKGALPEGIESKYSFKYGQTIASLLSEDEIDKLDKLTYTDTSDGKTYKAVWYAGTVMDDEDRLDSIAGYPLNKATGNVTLHAAWVLDKRLDSSVISIKRPLPDTTVNNNLYNYLEGSNADVSWSLEKQDPYGYAIYTDEKMDSKHRVEYGSKLEANVTYYAKMDIAVNPASGYHIDPEHLPTFVVNDEPVQVSETAYYNILGEKISIYCFVYKFTPVKKEYSVTLDMNRPDGKEESYTISGIPGGTYIEGALNMGLALLLEKKDLSFNDYQKLNQEYANKAKFWSDHPFVSEECGGFSSRTKVGMKASYHDADEYYQDSIVLRNYTVDTDLTLYLMWEKKIESIVVQKLPVPKCGYKTQIVADKQQNTPAIGEADGYKIFVGSGFSTACCWVNSTDHTKWINDGNETEFEEGTEYTLKLSININGSDATFGSYICKDTKLICFGKEYTGTEEDEKLVFYIPVKAEHLCDDANGLKEEDRVEPDCENDGSYTLVRKFTCAGCGQQVDDRVENIVIPRLGHKWGEWVKTKVSTESEEGVEQRVCKNDPSHVETRAIPIKVHVHKLTFVPAKEATETEDGNIAYYVCDVCGKFYSDAAGKNMITADSVVIPAKNKTNENPEDPEAPEANAVTLSENKVELKIGESKKLLAIIEPDDAKETTLSWISSNDKIVTVDKDGNIKGVWFGNAKVTVTTANGKSAVCDVTVLKAFDTDNEENVKISPEDMDSYVVPEKQEHKPATPKPVSAKLKDGTEVKVSVSVNYMNAVTYTGKAIDPVKDLGVEFELQDILDKAGVSKVAQNEIFKVSYKSKNNKKAGKDTASFYAKISLVKNAKKKFKLTKDQEKNLKAILKAENKELKNSKISYTINKASMLDLSEVKLHTKIQKDGSLKLTAKETIKGFKNIKVKFKADDKKAQKISAKTGYSYKVTDAAKCRVKITGNTNFTGSITVTAEK